MSVKNFKVKRLNTERMFEETKEMYFKHLEIALSKSKSADGYYCNLVEELLCEHFNVPYASLTTSGSIALSQIALSLGLRPGDEVITSPYTAAGAFMPIALLGCKLNFVDINRYGVINEDLLESSITSKTKAISAIGAFGNSPDYDKILIFARKHNLLILNDICQCQHSIYNDQPVSTITDSCFISFGRTKEIPIYGTYGAVLFKDLNLKEKLSSTKYNGWNLGTNESVRYYKSIGTNGEPSEDKAVACYVSLLNSDKWLQRRYQHGQLYRELCVKNGITVLPIPPYNKFSTYQKFIVLVKDRMLVYKKLADEGIQCHINYFENAAYNSVFPKQTNSFNVVDTFVNNSLTLPLDPWITTEEINLVVDKLVQVVDKYDQRL